MAEISASETTSMFGGEKSQAQRIHLNRVIIETSALLNIVKHCREADIKQAASGNLMGVIKEDNTLMITQSMPEVNKALIAELMEAIENES